MEAIDNVLFWPPKGFAAIDKIFVICFTWNLSHQFIGAIKTDRDPQMDVLSITGFF